MDLTAILIIGFIVLGIYKLFELFARQKERMLMIEKISYLCENDEENKKRLKIQLPFISGRSFNLGFWPLRISLLLIGIGIGCLSAFYIQFACFAEYSIETFHSFGDVIVLINFACISIFGGIGLLIAFLIEQRMKRKKEE